MALPQNPENFADGTSALADRLDASAAYRAAIKKHDEAQETYRAVVARYRLREIGDDEYLAARKARDAANAEFDAAFTAAIEGNVNISGE